MAEAAAPPTGMQDLHEELTGLLHGGHSDMPAQVTEQDMMRYLERLLERWLPHELGGVPLIDHLRGNFGLAQHNGEEEQLLGLEELEKQYKKRLYMLLGLHRAFRRRHLLGDDPRDGVPNGGSAHSVLNCHFKKLFDQLWTGYMMLFAETRCLQVSCCLQQTASASTLHA